MAPEVSSPADRFTTEQRAKFVELLGNGIPFTEVCRACSVSEPDVFATLATSIMFRKRFYRALPEPEGFTYYPDGTPPRTRRG